MICVERLTGTGAGAERLHAPANPFLATIGLRVEPAPAGAGVSFTPQIQLGSIPLAFLQAVEATVRETLRQGLRGWEIPDCAVFMNESGYLARQSSSHGTFDKSMSSTARDFRQLTPLVLMAALAQAGTEVMEPVHGFHLEIPADVYGGVVAALSRLGAVSRSPASCPRRARDHDVADRSALSRDGELLRGHDQRRGGSPVGRRRDLAGAVEEFIRWVSPVLNMRRTATADHELRGQHIKAGDQILLLYAAANRDPRVFARPDVLDVARPGGRHLAFGAGSHLCLGAHLARLEIRVMTEELLRRMPDWELTGPGEPRIVPSAFTRGYDRVRIRYRVAVAGRGEGQ